MAKRPIPLDGPLDDGMVVLRPPTWQLPFRLMLHYIVILALLFRAGGHIQLGEVARNGRSPAEKKAQIQSIMCEAFWLHGTSPIAIRVLGLYQAKCQCAPDEGHQNKGDNGGN